MHLYLFFSIVILIVTIITYINHHTLRLQTTIAIMLASSLLVLGLMGAKEMGWLMLSPRMIHWVQQLDFHDILINGMLGFLLFAGALHINVHDLRHHKWEVAVLASLSTIASCCLVGWASHTLLGFWAIDVPWLYCFLFGALISPTDPIAVLATFKRLNAPANVYAIVAGESLFNDGVGVVLFATIYHLIDTGHVSASATIGLFIEQAGGGIVYGAILGLIVHTMLQRINDIHLKILLTLSIVSSGYLLAFYCNISGPLAMVMAGLIIGHNPKNDNPHPVLFQFWEIIDELLNAILFFLVGLELIATDVQARTWAIALCTIPVILAIRALTVWLPMSGFKNWRTYCPYINSILIWGGLRGGLAIALALGVPHGPYNDLLTTMTFAVVFFSVVAQGLSTPLLVRLSKRNH